MKIVYHEFYSQVAYNIQEFFFGLPKKDLFENNNIIFQIQIQMHQNRYKNKINQQCITMLEYYLGQLFPQIMKGYEKHLRNPLNLSAQYRNISYHYICDSVEISKKVNPECALAAVSGIYFKDLSFKLDQNRGVKQQKIGLSMTPFEREIVDQIDLCVQVQSECENKKENHLGLSRKEYKGSAYKALFASRTTNEEKIPQETKKPTKEELFQLFVIHHSQKNIQKESLEWLNFIERFKFIEQPNEEGDIGNYIIYQAVLTKKIQQVFLPIDFNQLLLKKYFESTSKLDNRGKALILEELSHSFELTHTQDLRACQEDIEKKSFNPIHRRFLSLPNQHRALLQKLNSKTIALYTKLHPTKEPNTFFLENLTCRMMQNNKYKEQASWEAIQYYLNCIKDLQEKYTWDSFKEEREMNMFNYLGNDHMGRPVVLNTVRNIRFTRIKDKKKFIDFQLYFYGVYLREKMTGWVDQFDAIFDAGEQCSQNTDFSVTKIVIMEAYKLFYGQPKFIIGLHVGMFTRAFTTILFPLLPRQLVQEIDLFGFDEEPILEKLRQIMQNEVIPDFLGGRNRQVFQKQQNKIVDHSYFQRSFVPFQ